MSRKSNTKCEILTAGTQPHLDRKKWRPTRPALGKYREEARGIYWPPEAEVEGWLTRAVEVGAPTIVSMVPSNDGQDLHARHLACAATAEISGAVSALAALSVRIAAGC